MTTTFEPFGSSIPYAEPLWYSRDSAPYYKDSHRRLRAYVREYVENELKPFAEQYEKEGNVAPEVCFRKPRRWVVFEMG